MHRAPLREKQKIKKTAEKRDNNWKWIGWSRLVRMRRLRANNAQEPTLTFDVLPLFLCTFATFRNDAKYRYTFAVILYASAAVCLSDVRVCVRRRMFDLIWFDVDLMLLCAVISSFVIYLLFGADCFVGTMKHYIPSYSKPIDKHLRLSCSWYSVSNSNRSQRSNVSLTPFVGFGATEFVGIPFASFSLSFYFDFIHNSLRFLCFTISSFGRWQ